MIGARKRNPTYNRGDKTEFYTPLYLDIVNNYVISQIYCKFVDADEFEPEYLRLSQAEREQLEKNKKENQ